MTLMAVEAMNPVVTGLTTRRAAPADPSVDSATTRRTRRPRVGPSATIDVQEEGAGVPDMGLAVEKINKLLALPKAWDGYRAEQVTVEAGVAMLHVLLSVMDRRSLQPQIFPLPNGGLQAEWHVSGNSIEIEVAPDGQSGCALADGQDEAEVEFSIPSRRDRLVEFRRILLHFSLQARRPASR